MYKSTDTLAQRAHCIQFQYRPGVHCVGCEKRVQPKYSVHNRYTLICPTCHIVLSEGDICAEDDGPVDSGDGMGIVSRGSERRCNAGSSMSFEHVASLLGLSILECTTWDGKSGKAPPSKVLTDDKIQREKPINRLSDMTLSEQHSVVKATLEAFRIIDMFCTVSPQFNAARDDAKHLCVEFVKERVCRVYKPRRGAAAALYLACLSGSTDLCTVMSIFELHTMTNCAQTKIYEYKALKDIIRTMYSTIKEYQPTLLKIPSRSDLCRAWINRVCKYYNLHPKVLYTAESYVTTFASVAAGWGLSADGTSVYTFKCTYREPRVMDRKFHSKALMIEPRPLRVKYKQYSLSARVFSDPLVYALAMIRLACDKCILYYVNSGDERESHQRCKIDQDLVFAHFGVTPGRVKKRKRLVSKALKLAAKSTAKARARANTETVSTE